MNHFRKLVTVRTVDEILPIEGADAIECAKIGGWRVVVKKGEFTAGDKCVYFEIDSFLPEGNPNWQFLIERSVRDYAGVRGHVLRSIKLRGVVSQGLIMPVSILEEKGISLDEEDITTALGVLKYEPLDTNFSNSDALGNFPTHLFPKTDQERVQNLHPSIFDEGALEYFATEKLDGSSHTVYHHNGHVGICSRNLELKTDNESRTATQTLFTRLGLKEKLLACGKNLALQGELIGPKIQNNQYKLGFNDWRLFSIYDIDNARYYSMKEVFEFAQEHDIKTVPNVTHKVQFTRSVDEWVEAVNGMKSEVVDAMAEGIVVQLKGGVTFKVINNKWLLKQGN